MPTWCWENRTYFRTIMIFLHCDIFITSIVMLNLLKKRHFKIFIYNISIFVANWIYYFNLKMHRYQSFWFILVAKFQTISFKCKSSNGKAQMVWALMPDRKMKFKMKLNFDGTDQVVSETNTFKFSNNCSLAQSPSLYLRNQHG